MTKLHLYDPTNPLGLKIGQGVTVSHSSTIAYTSETQKAVVSTKFDNPQFMFIVGSCKKATGEYRKGFGYYSNSIYGEEAYEEPQLINRKYTTFYKCIKKFNDKITLVLPEHIKWN